MGIKNKISDGYKYYLTLTVVDWVDVFTRPRYRHVVPDSRAFEKCAHNINKDLRYRTARKV